MPELVTRISDAVVEPSSGPRYDVYVRAAARDDGTWTGRLEFTPQGIGETLSTGVETTQPSSEAVIYWATGLGIAYLEGAFVRAFAKREPRTDTPVETTPLPTPVDPAERLAQIREIERHVLSFFRNRGSMRVPTQDIFDAPGPYSNADLVRAFEDLEKTARLLVRHTESGTDWLDLTTEGARILGLRASGAAAEAEPLRLRH